MAGSNLILPLLRAYKRYKPASFIAAFVLEHGKDMHKPIKHINLVKNWLTKIA